MDVALAFVVVGFVVTCAGAFLRYDGYEIHDVVGSLGEGVGAAELVVVGAIDQQRAARAGVDCQVFHHCESMPHNLWDVFSPVVLGALRGALVAAAAVAVGWVLARLTRRQAGGDVGRAAPR
ncbi:MAG TPA: hypothetical protein VGX28_04545 [Frankiaceae bacterium]|nr:hypothetical protein [Frankiaceae bacterium]